VPPNVSTVGGGRGALLGGLGLLTDGVLAVNFQVAAGAGIKRGRSNLEFSTQKSDCRLASDEAGREGPLEVSEDALLSAAL